MSFAGPPVALVVAEEFEIARFAATLVEIEYETEEAITDIDSQMAKAYEPGKNRFPGWDPEPRGDVENSFTRSTLKNKYAYRPPIEPHNPMECFGTTAVWEEDGRLTVY